MAAHILTAFTNAQLRGQHAAGADAVQPGLALLRAAQPLHWPRAVPAAGPPC